MTGNTTKGNPMKERRARKVRNVIDQDFHGKVAEFADSFETKRVPVRSAYYWRVQGYWMKGTKPNRIIYKKTDDITQVLFRENEQ